MERMQKRFSSNGFGVLVFREIFEREEAFRRFCSAFPLLVGAASPPVFDPWLRIYHRTKDHNDEPVERMWVYSTMLMSDGSACDRRRAALKQIVFAYPTETQHFRNLYINITSFLENRACRRQFISTAVDQDNIGPPTSCREIYTYR